ncbi:hypothetical protein EV363DRAFT_539850 [Boletus edulis]|nr:hypothetical protein EV363DRAFT_539850 [Boletus edulis]
MDIPQPFSPPPGGQIQAGTVTYTTSTGPDGQLIYHPFKAVPARYQTPQGVIQGIQWVPAETTQILPAGATPANAEFAASWNRGYLTREDESALEKWQKAEEKRRKKEEKSSIRRLSKQFDKDMQEVELRAARDREIQTRERRRSFYGDTPPVYGPPGSAYGAYAHSPSAASSVDLDRKFSELDIERDVKYSSRQRNSTSGGDRTSVYGPPPPGSVYSSPVATYQQPVASGYPGAGSSPYNRAASPFRPPTTYTSSPNPRPQEVSSYPGGPDPIARAASPFARQEPIARAASPYGRPPVEPIARASSPYGRPPVEPIARAASPYGMNQPPYSARAPSSPYGRPPVEPIARASSPYGRPPVEPIARAASPYGMNQPPYSARAPSSPYGRPPVEPISRAASPYGMSQPSYSARAPSPVPPSRAPPRSTSPFPRAPSPYGGGANSTVYPPGHVLEGQAFSRSRAPSPMPGGPGVTFSTSSRMPSVPGGPEQQLPAPEAFSRPANAAQSYTPFNTMKIQEMEQFYDQIPRMPLVLETHDVYHQDWIRFMNDLALAWAGNMPIPEFSRGPQPKRSTLVADLIDLWNASFFLTRRVEVVLYKGRERRSGANAGAIDYNLPSLNPDLSSDSSSSDSESEPELDRFGGYSRGVDSAESRRRRKEEKRRRRKEKKLRKKAKELEKAYVLYLTYLHPRDMPGPAQHGYYA